MVLPEWGVVLPFDGKTIKNSVKPWWFKEFELSL